MPYSKDPAKYPPELQQLPELLMNAAQNSFNIPADSRSEAAGRRTQIQSYFAAVEHKAKELRALAQKMASQRVKVAQLAPATNQSTALSAQRSSALRTIADDIADAEAIADIWEGKARIVTGWMVKTFEDAGTETTKAGWYVQITRRTTGNFGKSLLGAFGQPTSGRSTDGEQATVGRSTKEATSPMGDPEHPCDEFGPIPLTSDGASPRDIARMLAYAQRQMESQEAAGLLPPAGKEGK